MNGALERSIATISGTVALVVALRALARPGSYVALPVTVCPNVIAAVLAAECHPFFVDIEKETLGLDPAALKVDIGAVSAVIAVHACGNPCNISEISELCGAHGKSLIEDCAQADGASVHGKPVGAWGSASIFSYGRGKIVDLGGGGLLLGQDAAIQKLLRETADSLPQDRTPASALSVTSELNTLYKNLYNSGYPSKLAPHKENFLQKLKSIRDFGLAHAPAATRSDILLARKALLDQTLMRRRQKSEMYRLRLGGIPGLDIQPTTAESAPWRFNIWVRGDTRDDLLRSMLAKRMNVSSWHPDIRPYLPEKSYKSGRIVEGAWYTEGILNLWLDDETSEADIDTVSLEIKTRIEPQKADSTGSVHQARSRSNV